MSGKSNMEQLLQLITALPWKRDSRGYVFKEDDDTDTHSWAVYSTSPVVNKRPAEANGDNALQAEANAIYIEHAANMFPAMLDALSVALEQVEAHTEGMGDIAFEQSAWKPVWDKLTTAIRNAGNVKIPK